MINWRTASFLNQLYDRYNTVYKYPENKDDAQLFHSTNGE